MKKVLLVEDDKKISMAISMSLKAMGYEIVSASDAVTATSQARQHDFDVVVLDINLPGGDGFVVAERLQRLVTTANVPIVFITASKQPGLRERAEEMGCVHFLEKPFDVGQLADALETATQAVSGQIG
ncbi:MAG: response regulator [Pseudomonadales bacterium]